MRKVLSAVIVAMLAWTTPALAQLAPASAVGRRFGAGFVRHGVGRVQGHDGPYAAFGRLDAGPVLTLLWPGASGLAGGT